MLVNTELGEVNPQNQHIMEENMDKPCEICGVPGYVDVLVVCSQCRITREHPYCMRELLTENPEKWVCLECISLNQMSPQEPVTSKLLDSAKPKFKINKPPRNTKVQYITPEEAMVLDSEVNRNNTLSSTFPRKRFAPFKSPPPRAPVKTIFQDGPPGFLNTRKSLPPRVPIETNSQDARLGSVKHLNNRGRPSHARETKVSNFKEEGRPAVHKGLAHEVSLVGMGGLGINTQKSNDIVENVHGRDPVRHFCHSSPVAKPLPLGRFHKPAKRDFPRSILVRNDTNSEHDSLQSSGTDVHASEKRESFATKLHKFLPNHPAESPTWNGLFEITGGDMSCRFCDGIQAHPPSKVHRKVHEFSKQLPKALQFELVSRLNLWVDLFEEDIPTGLDIGLYFFPSNRDKKAYDRLMECLGQRDMILRCRIKDVELLIFSSKHLQEDCQRMDKNYFLWGVFRPWDINILQKLDEPHHVDPKKSNATPDSTKFSLLKVKLESPTPNVPEASSYVQGELEFDRGLQRSFDKFEAAMTGTVGPPTAVKLEDTH